MAFVGKTTLKDTVQSSEQKEIILKSFFTAPFKPPANLTGEAKSSTSIFVQWSSLVLPNLRGILRGYTVYYKEAPSSVHPSVLKNVSVDISVTEVELTGLYKFTKYQIWATAFTTRDGLPSNSLFVTTKEDSKFFFFKLSFLSMHC